MKFYWFMCRVVHSDGVGLKRANLCWLDKTRKESSKGQHIGIKELKVKGQEDKVVMSVMIM